ncbi:hypothetical protein B0H10DRAFT_2224846 [Mycena sp. CBHHK59/15]|nr:hypothetical protein B0H10DRAFT_2224846 [Mycena sp. CBHHK59/15]
MSKHKRVRQNAPKPSDTFCPTVSKEEKAARHRKASALHYARHPEIREKKRLQQSEKRAAAKLKRRQWDPPKKKVIQETQFPGHQTCDPQDITPPASDGDIPEMKLRATGDVGLLSHVQVAQIRVAALNGGDLSTTTPAEAASWADRHKPTGEYLSIRELASVHRWRTTVYCYTCNRRDETLYYGSDTSSD